MIMAIWDFFFTRRTWKIIKEEPLYGISCEHKLDVVGHVYTLQDQFGNLKRKKI